MLRSHGTWHGQHNGHQGAFEWAKPIRDRFRFHTHLLHVSETSFTKMQNHPRRCFWWFYGKNIVASTNYVAWCWNLYFFPITCDFLLYAASFTCIHISWTLASALCFRNSSCIVITTVIINASVCLAIFAFCCNSTWKFWPIESTPRDGWQWVKKEVAIAHFTDSKYQQQMTRHMPAAMQVLHACKTRIRSWDSTVRMTSNVRRQ